MEHATLEREGGRVRLEPLGRRHHDGLCKAVRDGSLWELAAQRPVLGLGVAFERITPGTSRAPLPRDVHLDEDLVDHVSQTFVLAREVPVERRGPRAQGVGARAQVIARMPTSSTSLRAVSVMRPT
ncbi:hypothetical protein [Streptomyces xanthophaeus]|uniref:hypothetical protein n=1 Tax=Streptomyces xanthophaeus TaxID=67385 RepID=UPI00233ED98E|nr:hypothetical protein [Streptomyces xanthophaeus]